MITTFGEVGRLQPTKRTIKVRKIILRDTGQIFLVRNNTIGETAFLLPGSYEMECVMGKRVVAGNDGVLV